MKSTSPLECVGTPGSPGGAVFAVRGALDEWDDTVLYPLCR